MTEVIEPISEIKQLNDLREKVLRGEEVPPEQYLEVLVLVRKIRRQKGDSGAEPRKPRGPRAPALELPDLSKLLGGSGG